ncbi:ankyrin repeat domain-containing protein [Spiroplasma sp. AdecLV25b]|uniref:ankyrin repeat domain-containing protein n=1 Tax=Spiroplasma sp. AdecLV25b TaxID=3027162 RepID=UPI0027DF941E|nr:ankyrin repeat domain-containing protein [Spiroplasma sp. AdecLV25b]
MKGEEKKKKLDSLLRKAIESGEKDKIKEIIDAGADVNYKNEDGITPLIYTFSPQVSNLTNMIKLLKEYGADINDALYIAAKNGDEVAVNFLINHVIIYIDKEAVLVKAVQEGNQVAVEVLKKYGADINVALRYAVQDEKIEAVKFLIEEYADEIKAYLIADALEKGKSDILGIFMNAKPEFKKTLIAALTSSEQKENENKKVASSVTTVKDDTLKSNLDFQEINSSSLPETTKTQFSRPTL